MKLAFLLSGENVKLAKWEVLRCLKAEKGELRNERLLLLDAGDDAVKKVGRLGLTHEVSLVLAECGLEELEQTFERVAEMHEGGSACVRVKTFSKINRMDLERKLGSYLREKGIRIDLENPDTVYRVYMDSACCIGKLVYRQNKKQFSERHPGKRPFFMPSVILPKFARALVNLTGVESGEKILDPMCGTGSFLIEALLMGIDAVGMDLFWKIVRGCRENLDFYGLKGDVVMGDARKLPFHDNSFTAVVTDYPYLRSTRSACRLEDLYDDSIEEIARVCSIAVIVTNMDIEEYLEGRMRIIEKFSWRVHGTLTRRVYLCESVLN